MLQMKLKFEHTKSTKSVTYFSQFTLQKFRNFKKSYTQFRDNLRKSRLWKNYDFLVKRVYASTELSLDGTSNDSVGRFHYVSWRG